MLAREEPMTNPSPFIKWAGGKTQLLRQFGPYFPVSLSSYIEPFLGGGAVFFHLYNQRRLNGKRVTLMDRPEELVNGYRVVQNHVEQLIAALQAHEPRKKEEAYFYKVRRWDRKPGYNRRSAVERAARFVFLNRTCYNGLYRVNRQGQFNAPFGRYRNPTICNADKLRAVSQALAGITLKVGDFEQCLECAEPGAFVYLDPPYHPLSATARFTSYTASAFTTRDQERLAGLFRELDGRGCQGMLSNSYTDLIRELYDGYEQVQVQAARAINSRGDGRQPIPELLIMNHYERG